MADGDFTVKPNINSKDELGVAVTGFGTAMKAMREMLTTVVNGINTLASTSEELSVLSEQTSAGMRTQHMETEQVATLNE
ncbi:MAG: methyl-accepting chemotaxis protein [Gammaproteobacteria bacterium]